MVTSGKDQVFPDATVLLIFLIESGISWSVPGKLYVRVLEIFQKLQTVD
jgi:hypothetical protein